MRFAAALVVAGAAWAQPAIAPPQMGFVQDSAHSFRPAYGVAGNFILGASIAEKVVSQAFSGSLGLVKTDSSLLAFGADGKQLASVDVAAGPAFFGFSGNGAKALAYIPASNTLLEWRGNVFVPLSLNLQEVTAGSVVAIAFPTFAQAAFLVEQGEGVWEVRVSLRNAGIASQRALPGVHTPMLALPSGDLVFADSGQIVIQKTDASEVPIAAKLPVSFSLQQMAREWVQLSDLNSSARYAIRTTLGREAFYKLPGSGQ